MSKLQHASSQPATLPGAALQQPTAAESQISCSGLAHRGAGGQVVRWADGHSSGHHCYAFQLVAGLHTLLCWHWWCELQLTTAAVPRPTASVGREQKALPLQSATHKTQDTVRVEGRVTSAS